MLPSAPISTPTFTKEGMPGVWQVFLIRLREMLGGNNGAVPPKFGGTGIKTYAVGDMLYASASIVLSKLGIGASGRYLSSSGTAPQWTAPGALTKVDDTNVTLTLGGSHATSLLNAASLTLGWTGQLGLTRGGTGASLTASNGGIVYSGAAALAVLSGTATAGQILRSGSSAAPSWSTATYPATATSGRVLLATSANVYGDGPEPAADGTYDVDGAAPGTVSSFTITNGLITGITTR